MEPRTYKPSELMDRRVVFVIVAVFFVLGAILSQRRVFDPDEFMHLHSAWSMYRGLVPYRDFYDHYTPLSRLFLLPLFRVFAVETNVNHSIAFLFFARKLAWLTSGFVLLLTFWLGKLWRNASVGLVAVLFLLITEAYWNLTLEIRPDTLGTAFFLIFLVTALRVEHGLCHEKTRELAIVCSGFFLGLGFLTCQKSVYAFPGLFIGMCIYIGQLPRMDTLRQRVGHVGYLLFGFFIPLIGIASYFYFQKGLNPFIVQNFVFYLGVDKDSYVHGLHQFLYQHPFLGLLGIAGLIRSMVSMLCKTFRTGDFILTPATLSLIAGLFLIPTPYYQYYVLFLPLAALFASGFLLELVGLLANLRTRLPVGRWVALVGTGSVVPILGIGLIARNSGSPWPLVVILGYWSAVILGTLILLFRRVPALALGFFFLGIIVGPLVRICTALDSVDNSAQIAEMKFVMENTSPTDTVMDGYRGSGVFRPHAFFYWCLPYNERMGITEAQKQQLITDLVHGVVSPKLVLLDYDLQALSPLVTEFFKNNYEPTETRMIWKRRSISAP